MDSNPVFRIPDGQRVNETGALEPTYQFISLRHEAVENEAATRAAGRKVFDRVLYLRQHYPGSRDTLDKEVKRWRGGEGEAEVSDWGAYERFGEVIDKWEANAAETAMGLPLALLNIDPVATAELGLYGVTTIEALAGVPDGSLRNITGGRDWREKARRFIAQQDKAAPLLAAEAAKLEAEAQMRAMRDEIAALRAELTVARTDAQPEDAPRRGRPPKAT